MNNSAFFSMRKLLWSVLIFCLLLGAMSSVTATGVRVQDLPKEWKEAKEEYEKLTGKKKPSETILKFFRKSAFIDKALNNLVKAHDEVDKQIYSKSGAIKKKSLEKYAKAVKNLSEKKNNYLKTLDKAMDKEKDVDRVYYKALKMLRDDLEMIETIAENKLKEWILRVKGYEGMEQMEKMRIDSLKSVLKQAQVFISKYKANPDKWDDLNEFNNKIQDVSRNINAQFAYIINDHKKQKIKLEAPEWGEKLKNELDPWAKKGSEGTLKATESDLANKKLAWINKLEKLVEYTRQWIEKEEEFDLLY